ncbi:hypothetical protein [Paracoccus pantotrophus]|nr:hypothetical protein [Paracoccus pantotrophus]
MTDLPSEGGRYLRAPNGALIRLPDTPPPEPEPEAETPTPEPKRKGGK